MFRRCPRTRDIHSTITPPINRVFSPSRRMLPLSCRLLLDFPVLSEDGKTEMSRAVSGRVSRPDREQVLRLQALPPRGEMRGNLPRPSVSKFDSLSIRLLPSKEKERKGKGRRRRKSRLSSGRISPQIFLSLEAVRHERRMREDESSEEGVLRSGGWPGMETVQWIVRDSLPRWIRGRPRRKQRTFHEKIPFSDACESFANSNRSETFRFVFSNSTLG